MRKAAKAVARCHGANKYILVAWVRIQTRPVTEQCAHGKARRGVHGNNAHALALCAPMADQAVGQSGFADAGWTCEPDHMRLCMFGSLIQQPCNRLTALFGFQSTERPR